MPTTQLKSRKRNDYPYILDYRTRWADNDMYAHMNNSIYNFLFDSIVNTYLIKNIPDNIFDPKRRTPQYGMVVHSHTDYFASISFPEVAELGLRVKKLGASSVHYEIGLFSQGIDQTGMHPKLREGLEKIHVKLPGDDEADKSKL